MEINPPKCHCNTYGIHLYQPLCHMSLYFPLKFYQLNSTGI